MKRLLLTAALALGACGPKPPPVVVPPGQVGCPDACAHVVALKCDVSIEFCLRACRETAPNSPGLPTCWAAATACHEMFACDQ